MAALGSNTLGNGGQRRSGFGGTTSAPQRNSAPGRSTPNNQDGPRGNRGEKPKSMWTSAGNAYDEYHSSMDIQIVTDFYRTSLAIKLAPVFQEHRGPSENSAGIKKYDHESASVIVLQLHETISFREQLSAFINGALSTVTIARLDTKRLLLLRAEEYYSVDHPEYEIHANGLALSIEEDATDRNQAKATVFISRQQPIMLSDEGEPTLFYPELQMLLSIIDSYLGNCARVDFASCRLLEGSGSKEAAPAGPTASMPVRRSAGTPPVSRGLGTANSGAGTQQESSNDQGGDLPPEPAPPAQRAAVTTTASVTDDDLDLALGDGNLKF